MKDILSTLAQQLCLWLDKSRTFEAVRGRALDMSRIIMDLKDFQKIIKDTYYAKDSRRGLWPTFSWFIEEVGELAKDIRKGDKKAQEYEIGDVMAWLVSIANILKIDLTKSVKKYLKGCPKCNKIPCVCH